jgi:hypothetical protein
MEEKKEEIARANILDSLPQTAIAKSNADSVYDEDELEAGGGLDSINPSKIFNHRIVVTAGETGQFAIKRQEDDKIVLTSESFDGIILHGHRVYRLYQWMIDGLHEQPGFDKTNLTDDESQILAISYDSPKNSRGSFDISGHGKWLDNPKLFKVLQRYSRLFIYMLVPGQVEKDTGKPFGVVYGSFSVSAANAYNNLILQKQSKNMVLPYCLTKFGLQDAESAKGDKYKKVVFTLGEQYGDIEVLRQRIKPLFMEARELHRNLVENTQAGRIIKDADAEDIDTVPEDVF